MSSPQQIFTARIQQFTAQKNQIAGRHRWLGLLRLALFLAAAGVIVYFFYHGQQTEGFLALGVSYFLFAAVVRWHSRVSYALKHAGFLVKINEEELLRLDGKLTGFETGEKYKNPLHSYTSDLDIFGLHSLFQLLNRSTTGIGRDKLANWLQNAANLQEINQRQEAIAELTQQTDWRQHLQARGLHHQKQNAQAPDFFSWLHQSNFFAGKGWLKVLTFVLPVLTIAALALWIYGFGSYYFIGLALLQYVLSYRYTAAREEAFEHTEGIRDVLRSYTSLLQHIESQNWHSTKLKTLQKNLVIEGTTASAQLKKLSTIVDYFAVRLNSFIGFFVNALLMWDFFWMWRIESWKGQLQGNLEAILESIAEAEALASLAAFQFANPDYVVPEISEEPFEFSAQELGHPLILNGKRICNTFSTQHQGTTAVITGSNMSGKSTFLRAAGINLVLAYAGAAVCAKQFRAYPMQVFTSMRTHDDLAESTSSFYAELKRLQQLLQLTEQQIPVYFLLDEILKGTNSLDRHNGAKALIKQLSKRTAAGMISTHDLELGTLEKEMPGKVFNYSFNSEIINDKLYFDYKLQPGLCHSFNASKLMQMIGIEMEPQSEKH